MRLRNTDEHENQGEGAMKGMWEQIAEILQGVDFPPAGGVGKIDEPSGDELRAANLLERSAEPITCSARSQAGYAAKILHDASVVDEKGTVEDRQQAVAALKAGRFLREIAVSELDWATGQVGCMRERSAHRGRIQEIFDEDEEDRRKDPDYVPDNPPQVSTEAEIEAERCEIIRIVHLAFFCSVLLQQ